jgi:hypothetical protein
MLARKREIIEKATKKRFKRDKLQLAGSAPLHILANYNLPLNRALVAKSCLAQLNGNYFN